MSIDLALKSCSTISPALYQGYPGELTVKLVRLWRRYKKSMLPWVKSLADLKNFDQGFGY